MVAGQGKASRAGVRWCAALLEQASVVAGGVRGGDWGGTCAEAMMIASALTKPTMTEEEMRFMNLGSRSMPNSTQKMPPRMTVYPMYDSS